MTEQCHNTMTSHDCIGCKIDAEGKCHLTEQPNTNLVIIKTIQGLMTCVGDDLNKLNNIVDDSKKSKLIAQALEDVDLFERTTLYDLQKAFE